MTHDNSNDVSDAPLLELETMIGFGGKLFLNRKYC